MAESAPETIIQGLTIPTLLERPMLGHGLSEDVADYKVLRAKLVSARDALAALDDMAASGEILPKVSRRVRDELKGEISDLENQIRKLHMSDQELEMEEHRELMSRLWSVRKNRLAELVNHGVLPAQLGESVNAPGFLGTGSPTSTSPG